MEDINEYIYLDTCRTIMTHMGLLGFNLKGGKNPINKKGSSIRICFLCYQINDWLRSVMVYGSVFQSASLGQSR